jgi:hypothetical protein
MLSAIDAVIVLVWDHARALIHRDAPKEGANSHYLAQPSSKAGLESHTALS